MQSIHIGNFQLDDYLNFAVLTRLDDGGASWTPTHFDVIEMGSAGAPTEIESDEGLTHRSSILTNLYTPTTPIQLTAANGYEEGKSYAVLVKSGTGTTPTDAAIQTFRIDKQTSIVGDTELIIDTETTDAAIDDTTTNDNTLMGRLMTLERNQQNIINPRLKRILGLLGEHQLVDGYTYDDAGNVTSCRIRIFDTDLNRDNASIWRDTSDDADPASSLETGELARYTVTATAKLPRNLRTVYQQAINTDQSDNDFIDSTDGSWF